MKKFKVGVFSPDAVCRSWIAYTRTYNPKWSGCTEIEVEAENGTEAKKIAIFIVKERLKQLEAQEVKNDD